MGKGDWKNYEEWLGILPECIKEDPLWRLEAYRKSLFLSDLAWWDCEKLMNLTTEIIKMLTIIADQQRKR